MARDVAADDPCGCGARGGDAGRDGPDHVDPLAGPNHDAQAGDIGRDADQRRRPGWCADGRGANYGPIAGADASLPTDLGASAILSPDGTTLAFVARQTGVARLFIRKLDQLQRELEELRKLIQQR